MTGKHQIEKLTAQLSSGDFGTLAKLITLIESQRETDHDDKIRLLQAIQKDRKPTVKIGITGSPGVGKSSFLNAFVALFRNTSSQIAILTIDPSSTKSGGSILGDKLRMKDLYDMRKVYIRPSPSKGVLGGLNLTTWETVQLCEAAGFDYIFIETVGVGQSEIEVQYLTDEVWYLTMAGTGDEIQGIKKGILEVCDRILVTKMDLDPNGTKKVKNHLQQTLRSRKTVGKSIHLYEISSLHPASFQDLYAELLSIAPRPFTEEQLAFWYERGWQETLIRFFESHPKLTKMHKRMKTRVVAGQADHWESLDALKKELKERW